jgi:hypothetical protein
LAGWSPAFLDQTVEHTRPMTHHVECVAWLEKLTRGNAARGDVLPVIESALWGQVGSGGGGRRSQMWASPTRDPDVVVLKWQAA